MNALTNENLKPFVTAGNATFTVVSKATGTRFTFKVTAPPVEKGSSIKDYEASVRFVKVLSGPNNDADYLYIGALRPDGFVPKTGLNPEAPSVKGFTWFARQMLTGNAKALAQVDVYHANKCGRCGRTLTTPESVTLGLGPECAGKV